MRRLRRSRGNWELLVGVDLFKEIFMLSAGLSCGEAGKAMNIVLTAASAKKGRASMFHLIFPSLQRFFAVPSSISAPGPCSIRYLTHRQRRDKRSTVDQNFQLKLKAKKNMPTSGYEPTRSPAPARNPK
jgi:hypothetical protein